MAKIRIFLRKNPHIYYLLFLPVFLISFFTLEKLIPPEKVRWWVSCPIDHAIPFAEIFLIPYCLWYPLLFATGLILLFRDKAAFKKYMLFLSLGFGGALLICLLIPNGQDLRPTLFPRKNLLTELVGALYRADTPTNVFPSMHVLGSVAAAGAAMISPAMGRLRFLWLVLALAVCLSTMFIKQHSALDVLGALALSTPLCFFIYRRKGS